MNYIFCIIIIVEYEEIQQSGSRYSCIDIDPFCKRQFVKGASSFVDYDILEFERKANECFQSAELVDGYAPFCKHVFVENFANVAVSVEEITPKNEHLLRTDYEARTEKELPVLKRFFWREDVEARPAKYLDLILYSKEQIQEENKAMGSTDPNAAVDYDYGIISVKPTDVSYETPMDPITMMRNALGKEHGGSGVGLSREKYLESVKYWSAYALIK